MNSPLREAFEAILPPEQRACRLKGRELDGYVLEDVMDGGAGGFGVVYRAQHPQIGEAAVKVLSVDIEENPLAYERFQREVSLLCDMSQVANVVKIRHAGIVDGMPWYAMELVEGTTLDRWLLDQRDSNQNVTCRQLLDILEGALEGLHQVQFACRKARRKARRKASEQGLPDCIIHRDIKPGNIMVNKIESGGLEVRLIDFGIAGLFRTGAKAGTLMTQGTLTAKTPEYASPEMSLSPEVLDVRSDIFQVGLLAFEIITGERYWSAWPEGESKVLKAKGWPGWLKRAILRSLRWDRNERYRTAAEFHRKLKHPRLYGLTLSEMWRRRSRTAAVSASLLAVALTWFSLVTYGQLIGAQESGDELRGKNTALLLDVRTLRTENDTLQKAATGAVSERQARIKDIQALYDLMENGRIDHDKLSILRNKCQEFVKLYPTYDFIDDVNRLKLWLDKYLNGTLRIVPVHFENHGYQDKTMKYQILCSEQIKLKHEILVKGPLMGSFTQGLQFDDKQSVMLGWDVPTARIVFEADGPPLTLDVGMLRVETLHEGNERTVYMPAADAAHKLLLKIERIGFEVLPPKPQ